MLNLNVRLINVLEQYSYFTLQIQIFQFHICFIALPPPRGYNYCFIHAALAWIYCSGDCWCPTEIHLFRPAAQLQYQLLWLTVAPFSWELLSTGQVLPGWEVTHPTPKGRLQPMLEMGIQKASSLATREDNSVVPALVFYCCYNKLSQIHWLKTTQIYYLIGVEVRSPTWVSPG